MGSVSLLLLYLDLEATSHANEKRGRVLTSLMVVMDGKRRGSREVRCDRAIQKGRR